MVAQVKDPLAETPKLGYYDLKAIKASSTVNMPNGLDRLASSVETLEKVLLCPEPATDKLSNVLEVRDALIGIFQAARRLQHDLPHFSGLIKCTYLSNYTLILR